MRALQFRPGLAAGVGLGAFADGILFHQVLQWHHFVSDEITVDSLAGLESNTLADGLFHGVAWIVCAIAIWMLWKAGRRGELPPRNVLAGAMLVGWGAFTLFDGIALHLIAGIHHLYERGDFQLGWDLVYIAVAAVVVAVGLKVGGTAAAPARSG